MVCVKLDVFQYHSNELLQRDLLLLVCNVVSPVLEIIPFERLLEIQRPKQLVQVKIRHVWLLYSFVKSIVLEVTNTFLDGDLSLMMKLLHLLSFVPIWNSRL